MDPFNHEAVSQLHELLKEQDHCIVFAESCTAGLVAASLGRIPGISNWLAGSAVVYQIETKAEWLGVDQTTLKDPGPVSQIVSEQMVRGVLQKTPQATIAASITGHLGPNAPAAEDGRAWSSIGLMESKNVVVKSRLLHLDRGIAPASRSTISPIELRQVRQRHAVGQLLQFCIEQLRDGSI